MNHPHRETWFKITFDNFTVFKEFTKPFIIELGKVQLRMTRHVWSPRDTFGIRALPFDIAADAYKIPSPGPA